MKKLSSVFLCGDRSPYGMAHLEPVIKYFDVQAIIIADEPRWTYFRSRLSGGDSPRYVKKYRKILLSFRSIAKRPLVWFRERRRRKQMLSFGIPLIELNDVNASESIRKITNSCPEILISAAYPQIFGAELLGATRRGAVNFHPSLLPRCRGAHPHYWSLATGEERSGISAHFMTKNIDDGDIVAQRSFGLEGLYYTDLYKKIIETTPALVEDVAVFLNDENARARPQDENAATIFRNDRELHRRLEFRRKKSQELLNQIRAGGAYALHRGRRLHVEQAVIVRQNRHMTNGVTVLAGTIVDICKDGVVVSTVNDEFLVLKSVRWARKKKSFAAWVAKFDINIGETLE